MTSPGASGGHFHFTQDANTALQQIADAITQFPSKVQGPLRALQDELVIGLSFDASGIDSFLTEVRRATLGAEQILEREVPRIQELLARGFKGGPLTQNLNELTRQVTQELEAIARAGQRALASGSLPASAGRGLSSLVSSQSIAIQGRAQEAASSAGLPGLDFTKANARINELITQIDKQTASLARVPVTAAYQKLVQATEEAARIQQEVGATARAALDRSKAANIAASSGTADALSAQREATENLRSQNALASAANRAAGLAQNRAQDEYTLALQQAASEVTAAAGVTFQQHGFAARFVDATGPISDAENTRRRLEQEELQRNPPPPSADDISVERLLGEANADKNNPFFRADKGTIPLGKNGTFARFDENFTQPGGNREPTFHQIVPGTPATEESAATPASVQKLDLELDPNRRLQYIKAAQAEQAKQQNLDQKITATKDRIAKAEELQAERVAGSARDVGSVIIDSQGQGFRVRPNAQGTDEAFALGQENTRKLLQSEADKQLTLDQRVTEQKARRALAAKLEADGAEQSPGNKRILRDASGSLFETTQEERLNDEGVGTRQRFQTATAVDPTRYPQLVAQYEKQESELAAKIVAQQEGILEALRLQQAALRGEITKLGRDKPSGEEFTRDAQGTVRGTTVQKELDATGQPTARTVDVSRVVGDAEAARLNTAFGNQATAVDDAARNLRAKQEKDGEVLSRLINARLKSVEIQESLNRQDGQYVQLKNGIFQNAKTGQTFNNKGFETTPLQALQATPEGPKGFKQSFLGGLFSQGFNSAGDEKPAIDAIGGTAGNLAKYAVIGKSIQELFKVVEGIKTETLAYDAALAQLNVSLDATHGATVDLYGAEKTGLEVNLSATESVQVGAAAIQSYSNEIRAGANANDIFTESIKQAGIAALNTGLSALDAAKQLRDVTFGQSLGSGGEAQVNDAVANARKNFGGNQADILQAVGGSAEAANQAGLSVEEQANIASLIANRTGQNGGAVAGDINRLVTRAGNPQFLKALDVAGVQNTGDIGQEIVALSQHYNGLKRAAQEAFEKNVAGSKTLGAILPLLREGSSLTDANTKSVEGGGAAQRDAAKHAKALGEELKHLSEELKSLAAELGNSGLLVGFGVALKIIEPLVAGLDDLVKRFDQLSPAARNVTIGVLEAVGAFKLLQGTGASAAVGNFTGRFLPTRFNRASLAPEVGKGLGDSKGAAIDAETNRLRQQEAVLQEDTAAFEKRAAVARASAENISSAERQIVTLLEQEVAAKQELIDVGATLGAEDRANAEAKIALLQVQIDLQERLILLEKGLAVADAEEGVAARIAAGAKNFIGGKAGVAGAVGVALIGGSIVDSTYNTTTSQFNQANKGADLRGQQVTDLNSVEQQVTALRANADEIAKSTSGIVGGFINLITHANDEKDKDRARANDLAKLAARLEGDKTRSAQGGERADLASLLNSDTPDGVQQGLTILQQNGRDASTQLLALSDAMSKVTGNAGVLTAKLTPTQIDSTVATAVTNFRGNTQSNAEVDKEIANSEHGGIQKIIQDEKDTAGDSAFANSGFVKGTGKDSAEETVTTFLAQGNKLDKAGKAALVKLLELRAKTYRDALSPEGQKNFDGEILGFVNNLSTQVGAAAGDAKQSAESEAAGIARLAASFVSNLPTLQSQVVNSASLGHRQNANVKALDPSLADKKNVGETPKELGDQFAVDAIQAQIDKVTAQINATSTSAADRTKLNNSLELIKVARDGALVTLAADVKSTADALLAFNNSSVPAEDTLTQGINTFNTLATERDAATDPAIKQAIQTQLNNQTQTNAQGVIDQAASLAVSQIDPADKVGLASQAVKTAQAQVDLFFTRGDSRSKAYNDAITALNTATETAALAVVAQANAIALSRVDPRDTVALAAAQEVADKATFAATPKADTTGRAGLAQKIRQDDLARRRAIADRENARTDAGVVPGSAVQGAAAKVTDAKRLLDLDEKDTAQYYKDLAAFHQAQVDYGNALLAARAVSSELKIDTTNPVAEANLALQTARAQLAYDKTRKAAPDTINTDTINVEKSGQAATKAALDQQLSLHATDYSLRQISLADYMRFLKGTLSNLELQLAATKVGAEGYQQLLDETNGVKQTILNLANAASGQFNLGDIKLPTVFEVRRALGLTQQNDPAHILQPVQTSISSLVTPAATAATAINTVAVALNGLAASAQGVLTPPSTGTGSVSALSGSTTNHVTINGTDIQAVITYLTKILGVGGPTTVATTGRKT